jgi:hypothetical protein
MRQPWVKSSINLTKFHCSSFMNFVINNTQPFETAVKANKVLWQLYTRAFIIYIVVLLTLAIGLMLFGILTRYTYWVATKDGGVYYNLNFSLSLGIALFIVALIYFRHMVKSKKAFFEMADKHAAEQPSRPIDRAIEINDESIKVTAINSKHEYRWKCFAYFKFIDGILFLFTDDRYSNAIAIHQAQMKSDEFDELLRFVRFRFIEKK